jgi:DUF4097 and DUF4098 domain-containing protein YvlB
MSTACIDIAGVDLGRYVDRQEKHFTVSGKPDVTLSTFDGSIEVRPWDKPEVAVVIEKRGASKEATDTIQVRAEQNGNHITIDATMPKSSGFGLHFGSRGAKLTVQLPAASDVNARSGDGSIDLQGVAGRIVLHSGDGSIKARDIGGEVNVSTGDGSVLVQAARGSAPTGDWDLRTGDGSVTFELPDNFNAELDAHTGDGSIHLNDVAVSNAEGESRRTNTLRGRLGSGGPLLRIRTGDGSITLRSVRR